MAAMVAIMAMEVAMEEATAALEVVMAVDMAMAMDTETITAGKNYKLLYCVFNSIISSIWI